MKIANKRKILFIIVGILIVLIYYFFTKDDYYLEDINMVEKGQNTELSSNIANNSNTNKVKVYITGAIKNQGVYEIEENSRIADVIQIAGGLIEEANIENINLAYKIEDGMKINIPRKGEEIPQDSTETYITTENNNEQETNTKKININIASQEQLETLPGIGPATAQKILEYRKENGKFKDIEDIKNVNGIGNNKFLKIKDLITI